MKWFKHQTSALKDEKIQALIFDEGMQGYGIYFAILEFVGEKIKSKNDNPEFVCRWAFVESLCRVRPTTVRRVLRRCAALALLTDNSDEFEMRVSVPKMKESIDDYTRKVRTRAGQSPENVHLEGEGEENKKEKESAPTPLLPKNLLAHDLFAGLTEAQKTAIVEQWPPDFLSTRISSYIASAARRNIFRMNPGTVFEWLERDFRDGKKPKGTDDGWDKPFPVR